MRKVLRRSLLVFTVAVLALGLAAAAGFALLQTRAGQDWLAASLSRWISTPAMRITIAEIGGSVPFDLHVPRIDIADDRGTWLTIEEAELAIAPRALLARRLDVRRLAARSLTLQRIPDGGEPASAGPPEVPSVPRLPVDVAIDTLRIDHIHLGPAILGEPLTAMLSASGRIASDTVEANVLLRRTDETPGRASVSLDLQGGDQLTLRAEIDEPTGRVAQKVLGTEEPAPLAVSARGGGGPDSWHGTLTARAGELARLDAEVSLRHGDALRLTTRGELDLTGLRPPQLAPLVAQPISFAATTTLAGDIAVVEAIELESGAIALRGSGRYDRASERFTGKLSARVPDLTPLGTLVATPLSGSAEIDADLEGTLNSPRAQLTLAARDIRSGEIAAGHVSATADVESRDGSWQVAAAGALQDLSLRGGATLPPQIAWTLRASAADAFSRIDIQHAHAEGGGIAISGSGRGSLDGTLEGDGTAQLVADLQRVGALTGLELRGSLALNVDARTADGTAQAKLHGETQALSAGLSALDALLGPRATFDATLERQANGAIAVTGARVRGAHAALEARADISGDFERIGGTARLELPRLAPLGDAIGTQLGGAVSVASEFTGALTQPAITVDARGTAVEIAGRRFDTITADAKLADPGGSDGHLNATFRMDTLEARAEARFARPASDRLSIPRLTVSGPATSIEAALDVAMDTLLVSGTVTGRAADLSAWSALAGSPLSGQADLRMTLAAENGQRAEIRANARDLRLPGEMAVGRMRVEARLADLLGAASGRARIEASDVTAAELHIARASASARSEKPGVFAVSVESTGTLSPSSEPSPARLAADGEIAVGAAQLRLRVARLAARLGSYDIRSMAPLVVAAGPDGIRFESPDLQVGEGRITATGARSGDRLDLDLKARGVPLGLVRVFLPEHAVDGALDATLAVSGTTARPEASLDAGVRDLRLAGAAATVPALGAVLRADWKDAMLTLDGRVDGPGGTAFDISGTLPVAADPQTGVPSLARDHAIRLSARGDGLVESWAEMLPIGEDRISGRYTIDVQIRGTLAAPEAGGRLTLTGGRYLNFAAGTELRNLELELVGDGRRFVLRRLSATDAADGTLRASGAVDLAGGSGPTIDMTATFASFQAARRDDLTATANGDLRLAGTFDAAILSGRVEVQRAEIRIPERLPPHVARFDVIEINSERNVVLSSPQAPAPHSMLGLDLKVEIPARAFVRGRGLDSEWRGSLQVGGSLERPSITGTLSVVRGDFALLGKSFVLSEGAITFMGEPEINPQINVVAEHKAAEITARAIISGTVSSPTIALSSQPELPQDEVLARILFGRSLGQITPAQGLQIAQAAATLAGGGPGILDRLRTAAGLDRLDVSAGSDPGSGAATGPTVSGGRYVTDRVFVGVEQGTTVQSTRTKVEIELTPNVTVESSVGANSAAGVGVNWKWDY